MSKTTCLARRHSDQMVCHQCGIVWDVDDPEPPDCLKEVNAALPAFVSPENNRLLSPQLQELENEYRH